MVLVQGFFKFDKTFSLILNLILRILRPLIVIFLQNIFKWV
jgi:low affinity Fe/Cu permease